MFERVGVSIRTLWGRLPARLGLPQPTADLSPIVDWSTVHWSFVTACPEGFPCEIAPGLDLWSGRWQAVRNPDGSQVAVDIIEPRYGERHRLGVWLTPHRGADVRFAAGEFSNGIWGVFIPRGPGP